MKQTVLSAATAIPLLMSMSAAAFEQGDWLVRGGLATVAPNDSSSNIEVGGDDLGFGVEVDDDTQIMLNVAYFITDLVNIEILAATPFNHNIDFDVADPLGTGNQLGELKHLPPTITANYYVPIGSDSFKPYIGAGLNYTLFFDEKFTGANRAAGLSNLSLDDSFGVSAQVGFDYMVNDSWFVNASVRWIDIETEASFRLNGTPGSVDNIEVDPWVYSVGVGYRF